MGYQMRVHQDGCTVAWTLLLSLAMIAGALRYDKLAFYAHAVAGWMIVFLTYFFVLYDLIPDGFNVANPKDWKMYVHGVLGTMLLGFVAFQAALGMVLRMLQQTRKPAIDRIILLRRIHMFFGYFLAIIYKFIICYAWRWDPHTMYGVVGWEVIWIIAYILIKVFMPKIEHKVTDVQTENYVCPEITTMTEINRITDKYVLFAGYIYDARELERVHPGGYKVIEFVLGREVDRFIYGMYSAELYPNIPAYSHSAYCMQLVGNPIAKLITPPTYSGFLSEVTIGKIKYVHCMSEATQIYSIGVCQKYKSLKYLGYKDLRQLGQYHSFSIEDKVTRMYTVLNFLNASNIKRMNKILKLSTDSTLKKLEPRLTETRARSETELVRLANEVGTQEALLIQKEEKLEEEEEYLPLMLKIYPGGKLTTLIKSTDFMNIHAQISIPRGRGLDLDTAHPGRIVIVTGGTGLFPFSDLIDLLFKTQIIEEGHKLTRQLLTADPLLQHKPFEKWFFVFLIAVAAPEDIHPITFDQLVKLSLNQSKIKIVIRVSKNADKLKKNAGNIEFVTEYFNKRTIFEVEKKGFSKVWICGPPKLNFDTTKTLVDHGYTQKHYQII